MVERAHSPAVRRPSNAPLVVAGRNTLVKIGRLANFSHLGPDSLIRLDSLSPGALNAEPLLRSVEGIRGGLPCTAEHAVHMPRPSEGESHERTALAWNRPPGAPRRIKARRHLAFRLAFDAADADTLRSPGPAGESADSHRARVGGPVFTAWQVPPG